MFDPSQVHQSFTTGGGESCPHTTGGGHWRQQLKAARSICVRGPQGTAPGRDLAQVAPVRNDTLSPFPPTPRGCSPDLVSILIRTSLAPSRPALSTPSPAGLEEYPPSIDVETRQTFLLLSCKYVTLEASTSSWMCVIIFHHICG